MTGRIILVAIALAISFSPAHAQPVPTSADIQSMAPAPALQTPDKEESSEQDADNSEGAKDSGVRPPRETNPQKPFGAFLFQGNFAGESFSGFNPDYIVGIGDKISIRTWGGVETALQLEVDSQGNVFVPRVGPIHVLNTRNSELNDVIGGKIRSIYRENVGVYASLMGAEPVQVFVTGGVEAPGLYSARGSDSILHFIDRAGGINPRAGSFIDVSVRRDGEVLYRANLYDFLFEGELPARQFHDGDVIVVGQRRSYAEVSGRVANEAAYEFEESIGLKELLKKSGVDQRATHVRIMRNRTREREAQYVSIDQLSEDEVQIVSGDQVEVVEDRKTGSITVRVEGEFDGLSRYVLPYEASLQDLMDRIELTAQSNSDGLQLFRESVALRQKEALDQMLRKLEEAVLTARSGTRDEAELRVREAEIVLEFVERARKIEPDGRVVLHSGFESGDIHLQDGDVVRIPKKTNTVAVQGEVFFPTTLVHQEGKSVAYYITQAGGRTQTGSANAIFLRRANGELVEPRSGLWGGTRIRAGDEVLVLPKVELKSFQFTSDLAQVLANIALTAGVVLRL